MKICNHCKKLKPIDEFHKNSASPDGHRHVCKLCASEAKRLNTIKNHNKFGLNSKVCVSCNKLKISSEYYKDSTHSDGLSSSCKVCFNKNKTKNDSKYTTEFQLSQRQLSLGKSCSICGEFKIWSDFYEAAGTPTGKASSCISCAKNTQKILRKKSKDLRKQIESKNLDVNEYLDFIDTSVNPLKRTISQIRKKCIIKNLDFDLTYNDLYPLPLLCPLLNIPLFYTSDTVTDNTPSIDRKNPEKGYTKDNVWVISSKANRMKSNATVEEVGILYNNLKLMI